MTLNIHFAISLAKNFRNKAVARKKGAGKKDQIVEIANKTRGSRAASSRGARALVLVSFSLLRIR
jgi:hypothetical protein